MPNNIKTMLIFVYMMQIISMGDLLSETHYVDLQAPSHVYCLSKVNHQSMRATIVAATFKLVAIEVKILRK